MRKTLLIFVPFIVMFASCNWFKETPEAGMILAEHFHNKLYKKFDTAAYNVVFRKHLDAIAGKLSNPKTIKNYYYHNHFEPQLVMQYFPDGGLDTLKNYIERSELHGFNPKLFRYKQIESLLKDLSANKFKSIEEVYPVVADLELNAAEGLTRYHNLIYYGSINPRNLFSRYYVPVKRPDSLSISAVLATHDLKKLLKDIQPASPTYKIFESKLLEYKKEPEKNSYFIKTIIANMERLRWKLPDHGDEYVEVNIPDFSLTWFNKQDTLTHMKVCVGGKREDGYAEKLQQYLKTQNLDDKPKNHETPILYSKFNSIQVNPIWNIPVSIARTEIYWQAARDPYYLSNNNIRVYYKGKLVNDPDTIQWNKYPREKLPFQFKQGSGDENALGKFKFIFENGSSIYLHDTNNKTAFKLSNRAISHGCVRVERPLEFAQLLVKSNNQYDQLRMEVNLPPIDTTKMDVYRKKMAKKADTINIFQLKPKWFGVKKPVPILINYTTAWEQNGVIEFRPDVYGLDETLWNAMKKFM